MENVVNVFVVCVIVSIRVQHVFCFFFIMGKCIDHLVVAEAWLKIFVWIHVLCELTSNGTRPANRQQHIR